MKLEIVSAMTPVGRKSCDMGSMMKENMYQVEEEIRNKVLLVVRDVI